MSNVEVIPFVFKENDHCPITRKILNKKGDMVVSHGVDHDTGKVVVLPTEPFQSFVSKFCDKVGSQYFLK